MDLVISALILAIIGLGLALFAIMIGLQTALRSKKTVALPNGLYRIKKIGEDGMDTIFEVEEIESENKAVSKEPRSQKAKS